MDDKIFSRTFTLDHVPHWPCPTCRTGVLRLDQKDFHKTYDGATAAQINEVYFDWEMIRYVFHAMLRCAGCQEVVTFCGTGGVSQEYDDSERGWDYYEYFKPEHFTPAVRLIDLERYAVPEQVATALDKACSLFWADIGASANRVRTVVELILDDLGVVRRKGVTLHDRIATLDPGQYAEIRVCLEAVKWIGNDGSHEDGNLHRDSVKEGFRILEYCLAKLYPKPADDPSPMLEMAAAINKARGQNGIFEIRKNKRAN